MTEIAIRQDATVNLIQDAARDLDAAGRIATALVSTSFVPQHFRGKREDAAAAILYGATIGMDPATSLQQIYVIGGKPALYARAMVAIVMAHGHDIWTESEAEGTVTVCGRRKGSARTESVTWTTVMARRAGYTNNKKYDTDPRSMLYARASGDVARRIAPDALLGMAYTVEELQAEEQVDTAPQRSAVTRLAAVVNEPTVQPAPEPTQPETPAELITAAQLKKLQTALRSRGITDRDEALAVYATITGREVASSKELTKAEAVQVIDRVEHEYAETVPDDPDPRDDEPADDPLAAYTQQQMAATS